MNGQQTPLYEAEIVGATTTLRATVDVTDDGVLYGMLATEPNTGLLRQHVIALDAAGWMRLAELANAALATIQAQQAKAVAA